MGPRPGKRRLDVEPDETAVLRCKRSPPPSRRSPSIDLYSIPAAPQAVVDARHPARTGASILHNALGSTINSRSRDADGAVNGLTEDDVNDIRILLCQPSNSKCYAFAIGSLVDAAVKHHSDPDPVRPAALAYFCRVRNELEGRGLGTELAITAEDAMVQEWQEKIVAWLGATVHSPLRLAAVVEGVVRYAEELGGLAVGQGLRQTLSRAIGTAEPHFGEPHLAVPTSSAFTDHVLPYAVHNSGHTEPREVAHSDAHVEAPRDTQPAIASDQVRADNSDSPSKIASVRHLYDRHARKVKRKQLGAEWKDASAKRAAKEEIEHEWSSLSPEALALWEELYARFVDGGVDMLKPAAAAHLFKDGHPIFHLEDLPSADDGDDAVDVIVSNRSVQHPTEPGQMPANSSAARYSKVFFEELPSAERTVFLRAPFRCQPDDIASACRVALESLGSNTSVEEARRLRHSIIVVRFTQLITARRLANKDLVLGKSRLRAMPYPTTSPQLYVAKIDSRGAMAIRQDSIFPSLSGTFLGSMFHLRREIALAAPRLTWIVEFKKPPNCLRFTVAMQQRNGSHKNVHFEPIAQDSACPVCSLAHSAPECTLAIAVSATDLGVAHEHSQYLASMPSLT